MDPTRAEADSSPAGEQGVGGSNSGSSTSHASPGGSPATVASSAHDSNEKDDNDRSATEPSPQAQSQPPPPPAPAPTPAPVKQEPPTRKTPETTVEMLERLSITGANALNDRDHDFTGSAATRELRSRMAASWRGQIDTYAHAREVTFAEQSAMWAQRRAQYPDVHFEVVAISTEVDERRGEALVFMDMEVSGLATFNLQAMSELTWKKVRGQWMLAHTLSLRGTRGNSGGFG